MRLKESISLWILTFSLFVWFVLSSHPVFFATFIVFAEPTALPDPSMSRLLWCNKFSTFLRCSTLCPWVITYFHQSNSIVPFMWHWVKLTNCWLLWEKKHKVSLNIWFSLGKHLKVIVIFFRGTNDSFPVHTDICWRWFCLAHCSQEMF